jgi:hypothetical protein
VSTSVLNPQAIPLLPLTRIRGNIGAYLRFPRNNNHYIKDNFPKNKRTKNLSPKPFFSRIESTMIKFLRYLRQKAIHFG